MRKQLFGICIFDLLCTREMVIGFVSADNIFNWKLDSKLRNYCSVALYFAGC